MAGNRYIQPYGYAYTPTGAPVPLAQLNFYISGSSTRANTYSDQALITANPNPVIADSTGTFPNIFLDPSITYKAVLTYPPQGINSPVVIWTADPLLSSQAVNDGASGALYTTVQGYINAALSTANNLGAGLIGFLANATYAPNTVGAQLQQTITLRDTGATGLNDAGDAAKIDTLLAAVQPGSTITAPRTKSVTAAFKRTASAFSVTREADFSFDRTINLRVDQATGTRVNAMSLNVNLVDGDGAPTTAGEWRGGWLRGGVINTYNTTTAALDTLAGGYGIEVNTSAGKSVIGLTLEKMIIGGGYAGVHFKSGGGRQIQWSQIVRCTLTNGAVFEAEDGEIAVDCISGGTDATVPSYVFKISFGAFNAGVFRGTCTGQGGSVDIQDGSLVRLHTVQMELASAAPSNLPGGAQVVARGITYTGQGNDLIGCNLGAGTYVTNTVNLFNQRHFMIERCQFNIAGPNGVSADVLLNRDATASKDTYDAIIGYHNVFRGARAQQTVGNMTDVTRRMVIAQAGGALRQPHRGVWFPLFSLLTATAAGLTDSGLECMIDHSGLIRFNGHLTRAAFFQNGMSVCTFPSWLIPFAQQSFPVMGTGGVMTEGIILTNGIFAINGAQLAAVTDLWIPNGAWNVVVNPGYITVP